MKIAFSRPDGGVSIVYGTAKETLERSIGEMTLEAYRAHVREKSVPSDAVDIIELPDDWTPPDRAQRANWRIVNGEVVVQS